MDSPHADEATATRRPRKIHFLEKQWDLGGSTVFAAELGKNLEASGRYAPIGLSLHRYDESRVAPGLPGYPVRSCRSKDRVTRRGILTQVYPLLREEAPETLIVTIELMTCELMRHLPPHVTRIGVLHAVDDGAVNLARRYSQFFDTIVSVSRLGLEKLQSGNLECPARFVPPGIMLPERPVERRAAGTLRLLYLGRLTELSKRARSIVSFAKALETSRIPYKWTVAGDGDEAEYIRHALLEQGITNTRLVGPVPRTSLPKLFAEHDVIVSTSEREAFPLGLQESMAHGLVPVAVAAPGRVKEVVAQANGFLIEVDDAGGFARSIGTLATNRKLLEDLSGAAAAVIGQDLGWKQIAREWDELLAELPRRESVGNWQARLRVLPNLTPLFRGCPQALTELIDSVLFRVENLDVGAVRKIRRAGYRLRRAYTGRGDPGK